MALDHEPYTSPPELLTSSTVPSAWCCTLASRARTRELGLRPFAARTNRRRRISTVERVGGPRLAVGPKPSICSRKLGTRHPAVRVSKTLACSLRSAELMNNDSQADLFKWVVVERNGNFTKQSRARLQVWRRVLHNLPKGHTAHPTTLLMHEHHLHGRLRRKSSAQLVHHQRTVITPRRVARARVGGVHPLVRDM